MSVFNTFHKRIRDLLLSQQVRTTRAVLFDDIRSVPELERLWGPYPLCIRFSVADRASANSRADTGLNEPEFLPKHIKCTLACDVHRVATCIKYSSNNAEDDISGVLNLGLVCSEVGCVRSLRGILIQIFQSSLQIKFGSPPGGRCAQYRAEVFDLYLPITKVSKPVAFVNQKRRWILQHLCNGDLEDTTLVHHCEWGCCNGESDTFAAFTFLVSWALVPTACPIYSRKSWTGCDKSLSWAGLLSAHHSLLTRVMDAYIGAPTTDIQQSRATTSDWAQLALQDAKHHDQAMQQSEVEDVACPAEASQPSGTSPNDWTAFKRQKKKLVRAWLRSNPTPRLAVIKSSLDPMLQFLADMLVVGGRAWERKQQHLASNGHARSYIVVEAAEGSRLAECMRTLQQLLHTDLVGVSYADITGQLRCLRFRMIACSMTSLHALVRMSHRGMPYQLFQMLSTNIRHMADKCDVAKLLLQFPQCMCEPLSKSLLETFNSEALLVSDECLAILESLATVMCLNIAGLECKHAKNREHTLLRNRGWVPSLETISSKFLCRFSNFGVCQKQQQRDVPAASEMENGKNKKLKRKRGGGAWRAFISDKFSGKSSFRTSSMAQLSQEYRCLTDAELLRYQIAGEAGVAASRAGLPAFGARIRRKQTHAPLPLAPGLSTETGALVAVDTGKQMAEFGGVPFVSKYHTFKEALQIAWRSQQHDVTLSKDQSAELESFAWSSPPELPMQTLQQDVPSMARFFEQHAARTYALKVFRWHPPLATAVQAYGAYGGKNPVCDLGFF